MIGALQRLVTVRGARVNDKTVVAGAVMEHTAMITEALVIDWVEFNAH